MPSFAHAKTAKQESQQHTAGQAAIRSPQPGFLGPQAEILALQRAAGNRAVTKLLQSGSLRLQPKLAIGPVNDPLEHEADRVADEVMRMPDPALSTGARAPQVRRKCAACAEEEETHKLQTKLTGPPEPAASEAPPIVHEVLRSPGDSLDPKARAFAETRFGYDFSSVRVHTDSKAGQSAQAVNARAFTVGQNLVFAPGQYAPATSGGRQLLAHELAHVVQQTGRATTARPMHSEQGPATWDRGSPSSSGPAAARFAPAQVDVRLQRQAAGPEEEQPRPGTGAYAAYLGISLPKSVESTHWRSIEDRQRFIREYVAYARVHPRLKSLYNEAVGAYPEPSEAAGGPPVGRPVPSAVSEFAASLAARQAKPPAPSATTGTVGATEETFGAQFVSVGLNYEVVGVLGGGGPSELELPPNVQASLGGIFGGGAASTPVVLAAPEAKLTASEPDVVPWLPGVVAAPGTGLPRFVDPIPGVGAPGAPSVYTRFIGPETVEGFFDPNRIRGELAPRFSQTPVGREAFAARIKPFEIFKKSGISPSNLSDLSKAVQSKGVAGLSAEEAALLQRVTKVHAEFGVTEASPLISLTEHGPEEALKKLPDVATKRAYIVRVRIDPKDVGRVNEILKRAGQTTEGLAGELEVVVAQDLAAGGKAAPEIISITANPAKGAPLGGVVGPALRWVGRGLIFVGAALAVKQVITAEGPHRRETQGRAFGSFAGGTALGAFGAGLCIGLGVATAGIGIVLCGLGFGLAGAFGGGALGGAVGRKFD